MTNLDQCAMSLEEFINHPITKRKTNIFSGALVEQHIGVTHPIMSIPANYTIMDALCYIFDNDAVPIADVLQAREDQVPHALGLLEALEEGLRTKTVCLTCVKNEMHSIKSVRRI
jgi:hypothetical protein